MLTVDLDALPLSPGSRILDLGCGTGRHIHALYHRAPVQVVGVDLGFEDLKRTAEGLAAFPPPDPARHRAGLALADATRLPFQTHAFDAVICSEVLEHIPDYRTALEEISRIVKPGGVLAVSVPRRWPEWICWRLCRAYAAEPGGHVRIFHAGRLRRTIEAHGFAYLRRHGAHALHVPFWWLKCLFWKRRETLWLIRLYHRFLVWDLMKRPALTRILEHIANPVMGKSVVLYFCKGTAT